MEYKKESRICQNCKKEFIIEPDDFGFYEKIKVPLPTFCPECRRQRRSAWQNTFSLYSRKCDSCNKSVISLYALDSKIIIYCNKCWWSDKWDPKSFGMNYDFSKPFFGQMRELFQKVPQISVVNDDGIASLNCEYTQDVWFSKNCYMTFSGWNIENVMYSYWMLAGKNIMDCLINMSDTEYIYECVNCTRGYMLKYSEYARACINSQFLFDCGNCSDCLMCFGLRNKKYHYKNKEYSKEEYEKILDEYYLDTFSGVEKAQKEFYEFIQEYPRRYVWFKQNKNCSGDVVSYSKNTKHSYTVKNMENSGYCHDCIDDQECYDLAMTGESSMCYEGTVMDHSQLNLFGFFSVKSQDIRYTQHCHNCKHIFGCVGLRDANYCIFNKQYTKEEYEKLVPKIIEQMNKMPYVDKIGNEYKYGEYYPIEHSPFGYNETMAMEHVSLKKDEAKKNGFNWQDNIQKTIGKETIKPKDISESIDEVKDFILNEVLACVDCGRNYKIVQNELTFYRKLKIPIPRRCFYCRHEKRIKRCNPFKLWHRQCMCDKKNHFHGAGKCEVEFETSYAPDRPEIIYCEKCYQQEVY